MTLSVIISEENKCDIKAIIRIVNALQLFFLAEHLEPPINLPSKPKDDRLLHLTDFTRALALRGLSQPRYPEQQNVVLTSRETDVNWTLSQSQPIVISDAGHHSESTEQRSLWFATNVIRTGIKRLIQSKCAISDCICSNTESFHFLCAKCENILKALDFRDAIIHLRATIEWLNHQSRNANIDFSKFQMSYPHARLRLAELYAKQNEGARPFNRKAVLMVLHFLSDLVPFVEALHTMGASYSEMILIAKPYPYPKRDLISHQLQQLGVHVYRASEKNPVKKRARDILNQLRAIENYKRKRFVVIEDGGYFTQLLHGSRNRKLLNNYIGSVEQTTKGITRNVRRKAKRPILNVAKCTFKSRYEAPEIGRITVHNIARFVPNIKLSGNHAIVFGFGDIGAQVAYHLNKTFNMGVAIVDEQPLKILEAKHRRDIVMEACQTFSRLSCKKDVALVVGTTGETSISKRILQQLPSGCVIVSTSSDREEIDIESLKKMAGKYFHEIEEGKTVYSIPGKGHRKRLTVLAEGYPINFYGSESLPNATIDPIMTLLLLCGIELCKRRIKGNGINEQKVNRIVQKYKLIQNFLSLERYRGT